MKQHPEDISESNDLAVANPEITKELGIYLHKVNSWLLSLKTAEKPCFWADGNPQI
jgi:hypothetical protein